MAQSDSSDSESSFQQSGRRLVYLAAERTLLAWIRAAVTLMAFGFVVDRFGVFLRTTPGAGREVWSLRLGVVIVATGVGVNVFAAVRYLRFVHSWERGEGDPGHGICAAVLLSAGLAALGTVLALYLFRYTR